MPLPDPILRRAFRRSRLRVEGALGLQVLGEATLHDLALLLGCDPFNLSGALVGNGRYRVSASLWRLGLVRWRVVRGERLYSLTEVGASVAQALRAQGVRPPVVPPGLRVP